MVLTGLVVLIILAGLASASSAEAGEVHFDPESPAGKEYALPLQEARGEALGTSGPQGGEGSAATAPLFGVGVGGGASPGGDGEASKAGTTVAGSAGSRKGTPGQASPGDPQSAARGGQERARATAEPSAPAREGYSPGLGILILLGLLLLGAILGFGLRGRRRSGPTYQV
jgi:hypothetical protein